MQRSTALASCSNDNAAAGDGTAYSAPGRDHPAARLPDPLLRSVRARGAFPGVQPRRIRRVIVYVGTRARQVYAVLDHDQDNVADEVITIAEGLKMPNGVAYHDGALYVAEVSRILRFDDIENRLDDPPAPVVVFDGYPRDEWHGWKYLRIGPDGYLYAPVGVPCNVCETGDTLHGTITRLALDGSTLEVVARGVRNSVGFDWDPQTQELWFTDNAATT